MFYLRALPLSVLHFFVFAHKRRTYLCKHFVCITQSHPLNKDWWYYDWYNVHTIYIHYTAISSFSRALKWAMCQCTLLEIHNQLPFRNESWGGICNGLYVWLDFLFTHCRSALFTQIQMKDFRFSYKFKMACKEDVLKLCPNIKKKWV